MMQHFVEREMKERFLLQKKYKNLKPWIDKIGM